MSGTRSTSTLHVSFEYEDLAYRDQMGREHIGRAATRATLRCACGHEMRFAPEEPFWQREDDAGVARRQQTQVLRQLISRFEHESGCACTERFWMQRGVRHAQFWRLTVPMLLAAMELDVPYDARITPLQLKDKRIAAGRSYEDLTITLTRDTWEPTIDAWGGRQHAQFPDLLDDAEPTEPAGD